MRSVKIVVLAAVVAALSAAPAAAAPDRTVRIVAGGTETWQGATATGLNVFYFGSVGPAPVGSTAVAPASTCDKSAQYYCETTLLELENPVPDYDVDGRLRRTVRISATDFGPVPHPVADFDVLVHASDAQGTKGAQLAMSATVDPQEEAYVSLTTTRAQATAYALITVVYYTSVASSYRGTIQG